jgi:hypothetical protein
VGCNSDIYFRATLVAKHTSACTELSGWLVARAEKKRARGELKTPGESLSSEGANAAVQAERSTTIKVLRSLEYNNALILNAIIALNFIIGVHLHGKRYNRTPPHKKSLEKAKPLKQQRREGSKVLFFVGAH